MGSERIESSGSSADDGSQDDGGVERSTGRSSGPSSFEDSSDPDVLVAQIEATREDLAETLDAIADKVSPKKVAARSRQKVTDTVKEKAATAKEVVQEKAATAKEGVQEKAATAKEKAVQAKDAVADRTSPSDTTSTASSVRTDLPPTTGVEVPGLPAAGAAYGTTGTGGTGSTGTGSSLGGSLSKSYSTYVAPGGQVRKEVVGGGAAAALGLLLLSLRRRRQRRRSLTRR